MTGRERVQASLRGQPTDSLPLMPITMMFAAGVGGARYGEYARDHRVLADCQIRTAERFDFDFVSAISDPAREVADLGGAVQWFDDQPPAVIEDRAVLADKTRLLGLKVPDISGPGRMRDRVEAVALLSARAGGDKVVEGWVEGPCALAADLRGLNTLMLDFYDDPDFVRDLFQFVVDMEIDFARAQIQAGATLIGIGDAAASLVGPRLYRQFVFDQERRLIESIHAAGCPTKLHICGNTRRILDGMGRTGADLVDLDSLAPLSDARAAMGPDQVISGNIDPVRALRDGTPESVEAALGECFREAGAHYIVAAGCEVPRGTPPENVLAMTRFARSRN